MSNINKRIEYMNSDKPIINKNQISSRNYDLYNEINNAIQNYDNILFGPILSEFGWEIIIWAGIIRRLKIDNPFKKIIVLTRTSRKELYEDLVDVVIGFDIDKDYEKFTPRANKLVELIDKNSPEEINYKSKLNLNLNKIMAKIIHENSNLKIIDTSNLNHCSVPPTDLSKLYYNFKTSDRKCKEYINNIILEKNDKHIIILNPRHRKDLSHRNMHPRIWYELYEKFNTYDNCIFFISGIYPSYVKPIKSYSNIINLEDISNADNSFNVLGLTISLLNHCKFIFGMESAHVHLAKSMNIPMLFIGDNSTLSMASHAWNVSKNNKIEIIVPDEIKRPEYEYIITSDKLIHKFNLFLENIIKKGS